MLGVSRHIWMFSLRIIDTHAFLGLMLRFAMGKDLSFSTLVMSHGVCGIIASA